MCLNLAQTGWRNGCQQLQETICPDGLPADTAPYRLMESETLYQCYNLFNLLGLQMAYVTSNQNRLVGAVALKELKMGVEACVQGSTLTPESQWQPQHKPGSRRPSEDSGVTSFPM